MRHGTPSISQYRFVGLRDPIGVRQNGFVGEQSVTIKDLRVRPTAVVGIQQLCKLNLIDRFGNVALNVTILQLC